MKKYVVYSTPTCPKCKILKVKLERKGILFVECQDVEIMESLNITGVPVLGIQGDNPDDFTLIRDFAEINKIVESL